MNKYDFSGRNAVVTGGANGIGAAVVELLVRSGARVSIWDIEPDAPEPRVADLDQAMLAHEVVDVADIASVEAAAKATEEKFRSIDVLVNSAGIAGPNAKTWEYPLDAWKQVQAVNVEGTLHTIRTVVPGMIERDYGRIVNIASIAGKEGNPMASAYSASKAAVITLTKSLGKELADNDIAVNCITPVTANTRILDQLSQEFIEYMRSKIPRGRFVKVEEIASLVAWLACEENSFSTGATFDISGGRATY
ncbi:SDR family NAD(P)-dependent oxidoreductase [Amaricoccus tamworthensis]|uniref:SDR family NAD(P)-dependent oxidoreductase n=1 Tax=Amaricoccus tamworthensis TaxID=57002 RepID=UPI003C7B9A96